MISLQEGLNLCWCIPLGMTPETLRSWVKQAEIDEGRKEGLTTVDKARIKELERENKELRRANEILKAAATFFGA